MASRGISETNIITKSNKLVEASYNLTEVEQKIILTLISLVQPTDKEFQPYMFSIKYFIKMIVGNSNTRYKELEEITRNLLSKTYEVRFEDTLSQVQWLSQADYNYKKGTIQLTLHRFFRPYLLQLKREFTSYQFKNVSKMKGRYSIRIYELLKQYERLKERTFDLNELQHRVGASDVYPAYGNFKQRVLVPAQKQINMKSDISIDIKEIKHGRAVKKIKFFIESKEAYIGILPKVVSDNTEDYKKQKVKVIQTNPVEELDLFNVLEEDNILEVHNLAIEIGFSVKRTVIKEWLKFGKKKVINVMESIRYNKKIQNPIGFIFSQLKKEEEEIEDVIEINLSQRVIRELIAEFTPNSKAVKMDLLPDWMIERRAIPLFTKVMSEEEAKQLWNDKKDEIYKVINKKREMMVY